MRIEKNVILQVAHDIFLKKGYKKTNISEIATKAKIAAGTFYNYFDSKESLFLDILLHFLIKVNEIHFRLRLNHFYSLCRSSINILIQKF